MARKKGIENKTYHRWTEEEKEYLKGIVSGKTSEEIRTLMNKKFNTDFTDMQIKSALKRYKLNSGYKNFYKGFEPWNKGTKGVVKPNSGGFKKGYKPHNYREIGSERLGKCGYVEIKVESNIWMLKQRYLYEKYHNEQLKKDDVIMFADKNKFNFDKDNLIKVSMNQRKVLNQYDLVQDSKELTEIGINIANILIKTYELNKK